MAGSLEKNGGRRNATFEISVEAAVEVLDSCSSPSAVDIVTN